MTMRYDEVFWLSLKLFHFKLALSGDSGGHALMFLGCIFRNELPEQSSFFPLSEFLKRNSAVCEDCAM